MKVSRWALALVSLLAAVFLIGPTPAQAASSCAVTWGSLAKAAGALSVAPIVDVRAGQHACFDRVVVDLDGYATGYQARYVSEVRAPGSGAVVPLRGGARIHLSVLDPSYDVTTGQPRYVPANPQELVATAGYPTLRQVALAGSFEGETSLGVGVRARLPFRMFVLQGPGATSRIVLDVAHHW